MTIKLYKLTLPEDAYRAAVYAVLDRYEISEEQKSAIFDDIEWVLDEEINPDGDFDHFLRISEFYSYIFDVAYGVVESDVFDLMQRDSDLFRTLIAQQLYAYFNSK